MSTVNPIPEGFRSLSLHLSVNGAAAYIDFLKKAFDAVEITRSPGPDGKLMHALMKVGDSPIMLADDFGEQCGMGPLAEGRMPFVINLYVPDADAAWAKAVAAGCEVTMPIGDQFWGDRYGQVKDPFGFGWAIASRKENLTHQQMQERAAQFFASAQPQG